MASFDNYTDLQTAILNWLGRPGDTTVSGSVPDFITLFETDASRRLRTHFQEEITTIMTVSGTAAYNLPADFLEPREVSITNTTPVMVLDYLTPANLDDKWNITVNGRPFNYTLDQSTQIRFGPVPDGVYTVRLEYMGAISPLSTQESGSNWLLANYPDAYLWGSLAEAEIFLGADSEDDRFTMFVQRRDQVYDMISRADRKYRVGPASLMMVTDTGNP